MPAVSIEHVSFSYGRQVVLQDINLTAEAGDFVCLLGPSGCGKSTLLRLLAGLDLPDSGRITVDGKQVIGPGLDRGVVFQDYPLFPWMTAGENIVLALEQTLPGKAKSEYRAIAREHLRLVSLEDAIDKLPSQLSGGMRQRAAIARAFAMNSPVLLMDEPFGALDAVTRARLQDLLIRLWQQSGEGKTVFFVTHDVEEAILLANTAVVLGLNPGSVKGVFEIKLPRPRVRKTLFLTEAFQALRSELITLLYENVLSESDDEVPA
jgi:NitT/TauT family transport system ATP-binding protein